MLIRGKHANDPQLCTFAALSLAYELAKIQCHIIVSEYTYYYSKDRIIVSGL